MASHLDSKDEQHQRRFTVEYAAMSKSEIANCVVRVCASFFLLLCILIVVCAMQAVYLAKHMTSYQSPSANSCQYHCPILPKMKISAYIERLLDLTDAEAASVVCVYACACAGW